MLKIQLTTNHHHWYFWWKYRDPV